MPDVAVPVSMPRALRTSPRRRRRDNVARAVFVSAAATTFVITLLIIGTLLADAWDFLRQLTEAKAGLGWQLACIIVAAVLAGAYTVRLASPRLPADARGRWLGRFTRPVAVVVTLIVGLTLAGGWRFVNRAASELTQIAWAPRRGLFDISTLVAGTFVVVAVAMSVAVPLGVGAAIYLSEYARPRVRRAVKPVLEILAGIPSVVLAYFAIAFINPNIVLKLFSGADRAFTMLAAGLAVGVLTIPIIASVTEDALRAVPMALREASFGLGAQRAQTTFRVVFPAGISGITAALILGMSRAIGETMVVAIAAGATGQAIFHFTPLKPGQTMTAAMASLGFGSDQVAGADLAFQSLYFVGALLFLMTLGLNVLGDRLVSRVREVY